MGVMLYSQNGLPCNRPVEIHLKGLAMERKSGRNGDHYERCTLTMVTNLTEGATGYVVDVGLVVGVQLHGSNGARSSRLFMRGRRERMSRR
jgi:hypothetical protein